MEWEINPADEILDIDTGKPTLKKVPKAIRILNQTCSIPKNVCYIACEYLKSVTNGQTDEQTDAGQSDPYVSLCSEGDTKMENTGMWSGTPRDAENRGCDNTKVLTNILQNIFETDSAQPMDDWSDREATQVKRPDRF